MKATKAAEKMRRSAAEELRNRDAPGNSEVTARTCGGRTKRQQFTGGDAMSDVERQFVVIEVRVKGSAGKRYQGALAKAERSAGERHLQRGSIGGIAD